MGQPKNYDLRTFTTPPKSSKKCIIIVTLFHHCGQVYINHNCTYFFGGDIQHMMRKVTNTLTIHKPPNGVQMKTKNAVQFE